MRENPDQRPHTASEDEAMNALVSNLQMLRDPAHVRIIQALYEKGSPMPMSELTAELSENSYAVSEQLEALKAQGIVEERLAHQRQCYSLTIRGAILVNLASRIAVDFPQVQEIDLDADLF